MDPHIIDYLVPQENNDVYWGTLPANCPKPTNFENFLHWASKAYCIDYDVIITRAVQEFYVAASQRTPIKKEKRGLKSKSSKAPSTIPTDPDSNDDYKSSISITTGLHVSENNFYIETVYDSNEKLVKLNLVKNKIIPRLIMKIIALTVPYQKYLTSITINSGLCMDSLYEISKLLPNSCITEICLDGAFLSKANYHILLMHDKLKHLSLARCMINDDVVKKIADQLIDPSPAAKVLSALNLSTNKITDVGAKYLADMLRTNRQLSYLNLTGNMITDEGGVCILEVLKKFQVQSQELLENRRKYVSYLKEKKTLVHKFIKKLQIAESDNNATKKKMTKKCKLVASQSKHKSDFGFLPEMLQDKAESMAIKKLGLFNEPFSPDNTEVGEGVVYCLGNNTLCYLNLAYNNLSYISLKKLLEVLKMQKHFNRIPRGLMKVIIEGNLMPVACKEFEQINYLLHSYISQSIAYNISHKSGSVLKNKHLSVKHRDSK